MNDLKLVLRRGDAGLHVVTTRIVRLLQRFATVENLPTLVLDALDRLLHVGHGVARHQGSHHRPPISRIADPDVTVGGAQPADQLLLDRFMHDDPAGGGASLTGRTHRTEQNRRQHEIHIGARCDNDSVVAAQLEDGTTEPLADNLGNSIPHPATARCRHQRQAPVVQQAVADRRPFSHNERKDSGIDAVLSAHALGDLGTRDCRERNFACRLPQGAVAAHRCDGGVPAPHRHGKVERADHAHNAEGVPLLEHAVVGTFGRHGEPVELPR